MQVILSIIKNSEDNFLSNHIENPIIIISTQIKKNKMVISISDNGGGIEKNILNNIFNPYFSTKIKKNGTGLGLYMGKLIIEKHHKGELLALNTENGICFEIQLDLDND
jgi:C4-dicarboxylate-specific signal transduction histidine kinase